MATIQRNSISDGVHIIIKFYPEIRIVPGHHWLFKFSKQEAKISFELVKIELLIRNSSIYAKGTSIRTAQACEHWHHLNERRLRQRLLNKFPAFSYSRQALRLFAHGNLLSLGSLLDAIIQDPGNR